MSHFSAISSPFDAILEDLGPSRSPLAPLRTAAHAACARHGARRAPLLRLDDHPIVKAILGANAAAWTEHC